jgi:hypothetical protein
MEIADPQKGSRNDPGQLVPAGTFLALTSLTKVGTFSAEPISSSILMTSEAQKVLGKRANVDVLCKQI